MTNACDKIPKEDIEEAIIPLAHKILNLYRERLEEIPDDLQSTCERRPDFSKIVRHAIAANDYVLHVAFQGANERKMLARMREYDGMLCKTYGYPAKQVVFYLGNAPMDIPTSIVHNGLTFRYRIVSLTSIPYREFLASTAPRETLLAILVILSRNRKKPSPHAS